MGTDFWVLMIRFPEDDDVVSWRTPYINGKATLRIFELKQILCETFASLPGDMRKLQALLGDGKNCEIMTVDRAGWKKGKVRITIQLEIDEEE